MKNIVHLYSCANVCASGIKAVAIFHIYGFSDCFGVFVLVDHSLS